LAKYIIELKQFGDHDLPGYAHGGGIATSTIYKYKLVIYLALSTV